MVFALVQKTDREATFRRRAIGIFRRRLDISDATFAARKPASLLIITTNSIAYKRATKARLRLDANRRSILQGLEAIQPSYFIYRQKNTK
jgi:hypothetical protein